MFQGNSYVTTPYKFWSFHFVILRIGDEIEYKGKVHGSIGLGFELQLNKNAFSMHKDYRYVNPDRLSMPGGDEKTLTCMLTARKKGCYVIKEIQDFRGEKRLLSRSYVLVHKRKEVEKNIY